jgi:O-acetylhomoserine/O-acetylserine sulfhydrylase-like pyridoxal-dependent enzyme
MKNKIPFMDLRISNSSEKEILFNTFQRLMNHGQYIMGQEVDNFEKKLAMYCNRKYCIGVSSGTDAIFIALQSLGIGAGDEVVTTSLSWIATANAISMTGAIQESDVVTTSSPAPIPKLCKAIKIASVPEDTPIQYLRLQYMASFFSKLSTS